MARVWTGLKDTAEVGKMGQVRGKGNRFDIIRAAMILVGGSIIILGVGGTLAARISTPEQLDEVEAAVEGADCCPQVESGESPAEGLPLEPAEAPSVIASVPGDSHLPTQAPGWIPERLVIQSIELDAPVEPIGEVEITLNPGTFRIWRAPEHFAAGWHENSALIGHKGNSVFSGHHNAFGKVFRYLEDVRKGDLIEIVAAGRRFVYKVETRLILKEKWEPMEVRLENATWTHTTEDERITLVSCWPYWSSTHRLVVMAKPYAPFDAGQDAHGRLR